MKKLFIPILASASLFLTNCQGEDTEPSKAALEQVCSFLKSNTNINNKL